MTFDLNEIEEAARLMINVEEDNFDGWGHAVAHGQWFEDASPKTVLALVKVVRAARAVIEEAHEWDYESAAILSLGSALLAFGGES